MNEEPPSKEAVEAALDYASNNHGVDAISADVLRILWANAKLDCTGSMSGYALTAARILAAEVERLQAAIQRAEDAEKQLLEVAQIVHENSHPQQLRARLFNLLMRHMPDGPND
jgi:hypothetical protein